MDQTQIASVVLNSDGTAASNITLLGVDGARSVYDALNPKCDHSTADDFFLVTFEVVEPTSGLAGMIASQSDHDGVPHGDMIDISTNNPSDRRPELAYSQSTETFMVVYETGDPNTNLFNIQSVEVLPTSTKGIVRGKFYQTINQDLNHEFAPHIAYSPPANNFVVTWSHGDPSPVSEVSEARKRGKKIAEDSFSRKTFSSSLEEFKNKKRSSDIPKPERQGESLANSPYRREIEVVEQRQSYPSAGAGSMVVRPICGISSSSGLSTTQKILVGVLVPSCFIVAGLAGGLLYVTVIRKYIRKRRASKYGQSFDPELAEKHSKEVDTELPEVTENK